MCLIGSIPSLTLIGTQGDVKDRDLFCGSCGQNRRPGNVKKSFKKSEKKVFGANVNASCVAPSC
jgi:hypothetical protein